jgi:hypothetical protein
MVKDPTIDKWTAYCQKEQDNPNWFPWYFEAGVNGLLCKGAECPPITRGKRKGQPNFRKRNKATECIVVIPRGALDHD